MSTRMNGLFPCASCTLLRQPPLPPTCTPWGILSTQHIGTEPLSTIRSHFTAKKKKKPKNISFTMDSSTQLRGGEERLKNHKIKQDKALQKCKIMSPASVLSLNYVSVTLSQGQSRKKKLLDSPCRRGFITLLALDNLITSKVVQQFSTVLNLFQF